MNNRHLYILAASLAAIALLLFAYKIIFLHYPLLPHTQIKKWDIETRVNFRATGKPLQVDMYLPVQRGQYSSVVDEQFVSQGYGLNTRIVDGNRKIEWSVRHKSGEQVLYYRATVQPTTGVSVLKKTKIPEVKIPELEGAVLLAAQTLLSEMQAKSADTETTVAELLKMLNMPPSSLKGSNVDVLLGKDLSTSRKLKVATQILALAGIPARVRNGIQLNSLAKNVPIVRWLEVYQEGGWKTYNADSGNLWEPHDYLAWWVGLKPLIKLKNGENLETTISVSVNMASALQSIILTDEGGLPVIYKYSLLTLPIESRALFHIILTIPLGVFLLVILRNVIGIKTFGTFMPVLVALAFRETQLLWGVALFSIVISLGLGLRFYLDKLKLLLVPRLASVLIIVIMIIGLLSIFSYKLGIERGLSMALFPMVILTMTIERLSIVWEERGPPEAIKQGLGSLFAAVLAYLVINIEMLQHFVFLYPEYLLIVLAATLLLGRYSGYRLLELRRFKALAQNK